MLRGFKIENACCISIDRVGLQFSSSVRIIIVRSCHACDEFERMNNVKLMIRYMVLVDGARSHRYLHNFNQIRLSQVAMNKRGARDRFKLYMRNIGNKSQN